MLHELPLVRLRTLAVRVRSKCVNLSPKSLPGTLAVLGKHEIAYLDGYGSGVETICHVEQGSGHMCIMLCAFEGGAPNTARVSW
jgi:hypothetical protein